MRLNEKIHFDFFLSLPRSLPRRERVSLPIEFVLVQIQSILARWKGETDDTPWTAYFGITTTELENISKVLSQSSFKMSSKRAKQSENDQWDSPLNEEVAPCPLYVEYDVRIHGNDRNPSPPKAFRWSTSQTSLSFATLLKRMCETILAGSFPETKPLSDEWRIW